MLTHEALLLELESLAQQSGSGAAEVIRQAAEELRAQRHLKRGKLTLRCENKSDQAMLWEYARSQRSVSPEFSADLEQALINIGFKP